jgi:hypothetical protein
VVSFKLRLLSPRRARNMKLGESRELQWSLSLDASWVNPKAVLWKKKATYWESNSGSVVVQPLQLTLYRFRFTGIKCPCRDNTFVHKVPRLIYYLGLGKWVIPCHGGKPLFTYGLGSLWQRLLQVTDYRIIQRRCFNWTPYIVEFKTKIDINAEGLHMWFS